MRVEPEMLLEQNRLTKERVFYNNTEDKADEDVIRDNMEPEEDLSQGENLVDQFDEPPP